MHSRVTPDPTNRENSVEPPQNRRNATPFRQQKLRAWRPIFTATSVEAFLGGFGVLFVVLGASLRSISDSVVETTIQYDGAGADTSDCRIHSASDRGKVCTVSINAPAKMEGPIYVYYELMNYYQNHRQYVNSFSRPQLLGDYTLSKTELSEKGCAQLVSSGGRLLNPCGLVANSLFNDIITVASPEYGPMRMTNIAWSIDLGKKYVQPGLAAKPDPAYGTSYEKKFLKAEALQSSHQTQIQSTCVGASCSDTICDTLLGAEGWTSATDTSCRGFYCGTVSGAVATPHSTDLANLFGCEAGSTHVYWYPKEEATQYLYESFPEVISPLEGVNSPNFCVWMRTAAISHVRKLYGVIDADINEGESIEFQVVNNFAVYGFEGTKHLLLTTSSTIGGKNGFLGSAFIIVGSIFLAAGAAIFLKEAANPRRLGDTRRLSLEGQLNQPLHMVLAGSECTPCGVVVRGTQSIRH